MIDIPPTRELHDGAVAITGELLAREQRLHVASGVVIVALVVAAIALAALARTRRLDPRRRWRIVAAVVAATCVVPAAALHRATGARVARAEATWRTEVSRRASFDEPSAVPSSSAPIRRRMPPAGCERSDPLCGL